MSNDPKELFKQTFTIKGRIFHPNLLKTRAKQNGREVYDVMFVWKGEENPQVMQALGQFLQNATSIVHPGLNPVALVNPLKKYETYVRQDGKQNPDYLKGCYWVNAATGKDIPPQVVDKFTNPVMSEAEVYSGRNAVINISFYAIIPQPGAQSQKRGFGCNVNAVMLQDGGEREGGGSSVNVNQIFGGFVSDMGNAQIPTHQGANALPATNTYAQPAANVAGQPAQNSASHSSNQPTQPTWPPANNGQSNGGGFI